MSDRIQALLAAHFSIPMSWAGAFAVSLAILLVGAIVYRWGFGLLVRLSQKTATALDDLLLRRMRLPAKVLIGLVAFHALLSLRALELAYVRTAVTTVELLLLAYLAIETAETFFFQWWLHERKDLPVPAVVRHLVLIVLYTAVVLSVLGTVTGLNLVPVLATSTVVTVVVGLALQDTLGNLFSGLALHVERPFTIGDWVMVDTVDGVVIYTGWRSTHIRTLSGDIVTFPNSVIARARVQNYSAPDRGTARNIELLLPLNAAPREVESVVGTALATVAGVRQEPPPRVWLVGMTPLAQRYVLKVWIDDYQNHDDIESDVLKSTWYALNGAGLGLDPRAATAGIAANGGTVVSVAMNSGGG
ncbi:MAG: mechanosensitive ion channel [Pseudomonadota bacterium]|nr:mechanosensitive ion channel [Pseudomonadota bacterium]